MIPVMGIVKISDQLHDQIRVSSAALGRSINAQAEHWLRVGQLAEHHPQLNYEGICALLLQEAQRLLTPAESCFEVDHSTRHPNPVRLTGGLQ